MKSTRGNVVLMSSCAAGIGLPNHEAIAAAKAGAMTRAYFMQVLGIRRFVRE